MLKKIFIVLIFIFIIFSFSQIVKADFVFVNSYNGQINTLPDLPFNVDDYYFFINSGYKGDSYIRAFAVPRNEKSSIYYDSSKHLLWASCETQGLDLYKGPHMTSWHVSTFNKSLSMGNISFDGSTGENFRHVIYCNTSIKDLNGDIVFSYNTTYFLQASTYEPTNSLDIYTNYFSMSDLNNYNVYYSKGNLDNFIACDHATLHTDNNDFFRFVAYDITENDTYFFKFVDNKNNEIQYLSLTITNISSGLDLLNLHLSTTEPTTEPIYVLSNKYYYNEPYNAADDFLTNFDLDVSYGYDEPYNAAPLSVQGYDEEKQMSYRQFQFKIVVNGVYKFKIMNFKTQEISYKTFIVDNIGIKNKWGEDVYYDNYNENGEFDPTPVLFLEYVDTTTVRIRTQPFSFNELINLKCFTKFEDGEFSQNRNIYSFSLDTGNTIYDYDDGLKENSIDLYFFYQDVKVDGNYTFKFHNLLLNKDTESSIDVNIRQFIVDNIDNIEKFSDRMVAWCKLHFGILSYPFELIINIVGRTTSINFTEPILHIPELKDPSTGVTFLQETSYNFNDAVNINDTTKTIYSIYLVVVDVILIFLFIMLCKKTFEGVFK